jgi:hypothetical protein
MEECKNSFTMLDIGSRWRGMVSFRPWPLYPGKKAPLPLDRWLMVPRAGLDTVEKRKTTFSFREPNPGRTARGTLLY